MAFDSDDVNVARFDDGMEYGRTHNTIDTVGNGGSRLPFSVLVLTISQFALQLILRSYVSWIFTALQAVP